MSRLGTRLVAALTPLALLLPAAAHATQVTVDDATGDAKALNLASGLFGGAEVEGEPLFLPAPAEAATDIMSTTITHGRRVSVTTRFRDLLESAEHSVDMRIFTPDGRYSVTASRSADGSVYVELTPYTVVVELDSEPVRPCRSVRGRHDVEADTVTVSFPAVCIGEPRWVQVALGAHRLQVTPLGDGSVNVASWADDAFRPSLSERSSGRSPKVRRG